MLVPRVQESGKAPSAAADSAAALARESAVDFALAWHFLTFETNSFVLFDP